MRNIIKQKLREHIVGYDKKDKYELLEKDIAGLVEKYKKDFE